MNINMNQDQVMALDFLHTARSGVLFYAMSLLEATQPEVRSTLTNQLKDGLTLHREIAQTMHQKGWFPTLDEMPDSTAFQDPHIPRTEPPRLKL